MFIDIFDTVLQRTVWVRRDSIVMFSVYEGITNIVLFGTNDQDNRLWAKGDLTNEILGVEQ